MAAVGKGRGSLMTRHSTPGEGSRQQSCPSLAYLVRKSPGGPGTQEAVVSLKPGGVPPGR